MRSFVTDISPHEDRLFMIFFVLVLVFSLFLATYHLFIGDVMFHVDIARDLLLVDDMVKTNKLSLIGPRAGGIQGLFFGPIWYYAMIPVFILGNGNPVAVGVFWVGACIAALISLFYVADRVFGRRIAMLSVLLYALYLATIAEGFTQSFGSLIVSPLIFYLVYRFSEEQKLSTLILLIFLLGITFHLQPAFAMLVIAITFLYTSYLLYKAKKLRYLFTYPLIAIPLFTYVLFELRHGFLMFHSFASFLTSPSVGERISALDLIWNRVGGFISRMNLLGREDLFTSLFFLAVNGSVLYFVYKKRAVPFRKFIFIIYGYYLGFWILSFLFKKFIWDYYHWGFFPLFFLSFAALYPLIGKKLFAVLYSAVFVVLFIGVTVTTFNRAQTFTGYNSSSWKLNRTIADMVFSEEATREFGYFVYSPDEFGYSVKYAMNYNDLSPSRERAFLCQKRPETFLIYYPTPEKYAKTDPVYWKQQRVHIAGEPVATWVFGEGVKVEKYALSANQITVPSDPNIVCDFHFR